jgi:hypothetical protein
MEGRAMDITMCASKDCASEGYLSLASGALFCEDCGKPDVALAMTRLSKSLIRKDEAAELRRYAILASATWAAACTGERP